jgi:hypothetical protein
MKKVRITESQLKGLVRRMVNENVEKSSIPAIVDFYEKSKNKKTFIKKLKEKTSGMGNSELPETPTKEQLYHFLKQINKNKLERIKKVLERDINSKSITESQLRGLVRKMIREEMEMSSDMPSANNDPTTREVYDFASDKLDEYRRKGSLSLNYLNMIGSIIPTNTFKEIYTAAIYYFAKDYNQGEGSNLYELLQEPRFQRMAETNMGKSINQEKNKIVVRLYDDLVKNFIN